MLGIYTLDTATNQWVKREEASSMAEAQTIATSYRVLGWRAHIIEWTEA